MSNFLTLVIYTVLAYSLSNMIVYSSGPFNIFKNTRAIAEELNPQLGELFQCMICMPFWVGLFFGICDSCFTHAGITPFTMIMPHSNWMITSFLDAIFTSGAVWLIHTWQENMERAWNGDGE